MGNVLDRYRRVPFVCTTQGRDGRIRHLEIPGGVMVTVRSVEMPLFPVSVLCRVVERDREAIKKWEVVRPRTFWREMDPSLGPQLLTSDFAVLPKPTFSVPGSTIHRWYSEGQILAVKKALQCFGAERGLNKIDWHGIAEMILSEWNK